MSNDAARLADLRSATTAMLLGFDDERWTDADMRAPSLLPGWSRGHVLTHIARNADGIARTLAGALQGEIVARYPDGLAGRNADIEAGAGRPALDLVADVRESAERLDRLFGAIADADGWDLPTEDHPARDWLVRRWREVEIHRVDAAGTFGPADWSPSFVRYLLPELARTLEQRAPHALRVVVAAEGSVAPDLAGQTWVVGDGDAVEVTGPDWALAAWLVGRPEAAGDTLGATPDLAPWL